MDQNMPRTNIPQSKEVYKPLFVSVIFIVSCSIALIVYHFFIVKLMRWRQQNNVLQPQGDTTVNGVEKKLLDSIPVIIYSVKNRRAFCLQQTECGVCLGELEEVDRVRILPGCKHTFHVPCIDKWFMGHISCPLCRLPVSASGLDTLLQLPAEVSEGDDVADEGRNSPSTGCVTRVSMIRHCASMIMGGEKAEKGLRNMKRSVSMDHFDTVRDEENSFGLV